MHAPLMHPPFQVRDAETRARDAETRARTAEQQLTEKSELIKFVEEEVERVKGEGRGREDWVSRLQSKVLKKARR